MNEKVCGKYIAYIKKLPHLHIIPDPFSSISIAFSESALNIENCMSCNRELHTFC